MRRAVLALVLAACDAGALPEPQTAAPPTVSPGTCPASEPLLLPSLTPIDDPSVTEMGHRFDSYPPRVFPLPDGRRIVLDIYRSVGFLWSPATHQRTDLGSVTLLPAGPRGQVVVHHEGDDLVYADVDPTRDALRTLWRIPTSSHAALVGMLGDALVGASVPGELLCLRPGASTVSLAAHIPSGLSPVSADAIRGTRLLLVGPHREGSGGMAGWDRPFTVGVQVLDLATGALRSLGTVAGSYTTTTAMPHAYVSFRWSDGSEDVLPYGRDVRHVVDVTSEMIDQRPRN